MESRRGIRGGYLLAHPAERISLLQIVVALEGPLGMTECSAVQGSCGHEPHCRVRGSWRRISRVIESALATTSLADMLVPEPAPARAHRSAPQRASAP